MDKNMSSVPHTAYMPWVVTGARPSGNVAEVIKDGGRAGFNLRIGAYKYTY